MLKATIDVGQIVRDLMYNKLFEIARPASKTTDLDVFSFICPFCGGRAVCYRGDGNHAKIECEKCIVEAEGVL